MTEREPYVPSLDEVREVYAHAVTASIRTRGQRRAEFDRWLSAHDEAVRQEERDKAARVAESVKTNGWDGLSAKERIAARIRQGKEQDRG